MRGGGGGSQLPAWMSFHFSHKFSTNSTSQLPMFQTQTLYPPSSPASPLICIQTSSGIVFCGIWSAPLFTSQKSQHHDKQTKASRCHHSLWHRQTMWAPIYMQTRDPPLIFPVFVCSALLSWFIVDSLSLPPLLSLIKYYDSSFAQWCKQHGSFITMP